VQKHLLLRYTRNKDYRRLLEWRSDLWLKMLKSGKADAEKYVTSFDAGYYGKLLEKLGMRFCFYF
jgi:hypothetical protein